MKDKPNNVFFVEKRIQNYKRKDKLSNILQFYGIHQSMGAKCTYYYNSVFESFSSTLKKELIYREKYYEVEDLQNSLFEYIEIFYNRQRKHSTIGYLSPFEFKSKNVIN